MAALFTKHMDPATKGDRNGALALLTHSRAAPPPRARAPTPPHSPMRCTHPLSLRWRAPRLPGHVLGAHRHRLVCGRQAQRRGWVGGGGAGRRWLAAWGASATLPACTTRLHQTVHPLHPRTNPSTDILVADGMGFMFDAFGDKLKAQWPELVAHADRVFAAPGIKEYMASPLRLPDAIPS